MVTEAVACEREIEGERLPAEERKESEGENGIFRENLGIGIEIRVCVTLSSFSFCVGRNDWISARERIPLGTPMR